MSSAETVQSLDSILTRLALTSEAQLEKVLSKLIPAVIRELRCTDVALRNKVLQILSHVNTRLDANKDVALPLLDLAALVREADRDDQPMIRGFALVYLEKAVERSTPSARLAAVEQILPSVSRRPPQHQNIVLRVAVGCLAEYGRTRPAEQVKKQKMESEQGFAFLKAAADQRVFLDWVQCFLLWQTKERVTSNKELTVNGRPAEIGAEVQRVLATVPSGLSHQKAKDIEGKVLWTEAKILQSKLGLLRFLADAELGAGSFLPFLVASCDPVDEVQREAEALLRKHFRIESDSQDLDLNDPSLLQQIFDLFQGSTATGVLPTAETVTSFRTPASHLLKAKLLGVLVKSAEAANFYPATLQMSLRLQAMEFSVWVVKHAREEVLGRFAEPMLGELLGLVREDLEAVQRGYVYEAIGQLAQRQPSLFREKIQLAEELFGALETEPPGVRSQLQSAVSALSAAFRSADGAVEALLMKSIHCNSSAVRLVAVTWGMRLFPFHSPLGRYLCVVAAGDERPEVESEGRAGLDPSSFGREIHNDGTHAFPPISEFLAFLERHSLQVKVKLESSSRVYAELIAFLRKVHLAGSTQEQQLSSEVLKELVELVEGALQRSAPTVLVAEALAALVSLLMSNPDAMSQWCGEKLNVLRAWLPHVDGIVRGLAAQLMGMGVTSRSSAEALHLVQELKGVLGSAPKAKFESRSGVIHALGYIGAMCDLAEVLSEVAGATEALVEVLAASDPHLASSAALAISYQFLNPHFSRTFAESRSIEVSFVDWMSEAVCGPILNLCRHRDLHVASRAVLAAGLLAKGLNVPELQSTCLMGLISLQNLKSEELQCLVGEALALGFAKAAISTDWILHFPYTTLRQLPLQPSDPPHGEGDIHDRVVRALLEGMRHSRSEHRAACASHLVTLLTYTPQHPSLLKALQSAQQGFLSLLGDKNGWTQEMASRGVSLVYSSGDASSKATLLTGLTAVLQDPSKRGKAIKVEAETEVFSEGELGKAPGGGSLTTYRELCSLATDMGQPELLYKFMDLANHQAALNSQRGAAVGFDHIAQVAGEDLKPYFGTLLPRIYRLQFDPNPSVQETMHNIWRSLVTTGAKALEPRLEGIVKELLKEITSRLWRNRESSARAMSELMQGRSWPQLQSFFDEVWKKAFRVADDIKESVRQAGVQLLKTLKRVTLRLCDPHVSSPPVVAEAVAVVLPVLLEVVMQSTVADVVLVSFSTLSDVTAACPAELLRPHLPLLVPSLLESLTRMESSRLDELQLMAAGEGLDTAKLESVRVQLGSMSPVQHVLNRCLRITDVATLDGLMPKLKEVIQRGVGLNTRVGTARFVSGLAAELGLDLGSHTSKLLKLYLNKSLVTESSPALRKAYCSTVGTLCRAAVPGVMQKAVRQCLEALEEEEQDTLGVATVFRALYSQAPVHFANHAQQIVPVAFVLRFESSAAAPEWQALLEESTGTESGTVRLYHAELVPYIEAAFSRRRWSDRVAAAKATERMYQADAESLAPYSEALLQVILEQLQGRQWDGKEALIKAATQICISSPTTKTSTVIATFKAATAKGKKAFREAALVGLGDVVEKYSQKGEAVEELMPFLLSSVDVTGGGAGSEEAAEKLPLTAWLKCAGQLRQGLDLRQHGAQCDDEAFQVFGKVLTSPRPWNLKLAVLQSLGSFLRGSRFASANLSSQLGRLADGLCACLEEQKYEQLRLAALDVLDAVISTAADHEVAAPTVGPRLAAFAERERSRQVKARLEALHQGATTRQNETDNP